MPVLDLSHLVTKNVSLEVTEDAEHRRTQETIDNQHARWRTNATHAVFLLFALGFGGATIWAIAKSGAAVQTVTEIVKIGTPAGLAFLMGQKSKG